jgi:Zn-dependent M28 family amino/carboxypeptidase
LLEEAAARYGFVISPDPRPEQGSYYRSDHFSFARLGVPAFSLNLGLEYEGPAAAEGLARAREYGAKRYHQPSDEFDETWDWSSVERLSRLGLTLGVNAANAPRAFTWKPGDEFLAARQASLGSK